MKRIYLFVVVFLVGGVFAGLGVAEGAGSASCSAADMNKDGRVNIADLVRVARLFGQRTAPSNLVPEDANQDGIVNIIDLVTVARQFGADCTNFIVGDFSGDACVNIQDLVLVASQQTTSPLDQNEFYSRLFQSAGHYGEGCVPPVPKLPYSAETDVNGDFIINKSDFDVVAGQFGQSGSGLQGDVNGDSSVTIEDLILIAQRLGERAPQLPDLVVTSVTAHRLVGGQDVAYTNGDITVGPWDAVVFVAHVKNAGPVALPAGYPVRWFVSRAEKQGDGSWKTIQKLEFDKPSSESPALQPREVSGDDDFQFVWIIDPAKVVPGTYRFAVLLNLGNMRKENVNESSTKQNLGLFSGQVIVQAASPSTTPVRGDVNGDGKVNVLDATALERRIRLAVLFDYDGDGSIGVGDAKILESVVAGTRSVPAGKMGDVDGNGMVNVFDVTTLERSVADLDFDGDGALGDGDVRALEQIVAGMSQASLQQDASERVVFVPVRQDLAKPQGFASVLKSIFWVIGE